MKRSGIRKNNRGDSLILVIGCIALLSIVGVILLAKTMDNRKMKLAEEQAQASFFGAEGGSAEMVTVIENIALGVVEDAFVDMMVEFSLTSVQADREQRFSDYFSRKIEQKLSTANFQAELEDALGLAGTGGLTDLKVTCGAVERVGTTPVNGYTSAVRVKDVTFSYTSAGSRSSITTDICIKAKIPDVEHGFNSGISCDFADFALITDGTTTSAYVGGFEVIGNMYVGEDFVTTGANTVTWVKDAKKLLVKDELKVEPGSKVTISNGTVTMENGEGIWAGGISVKMGELKTDGVNVYVEDDLAVEGKAGTTVVEMKGNSSEYVGFSGNSTAAVNHERSSAITINEIKNLTLDLSGLRNVYINGDSYICEDNSKWGSWDSGSITSAEGIMQGESVAFKDMQAMYLFPGSCLPKGHNPIIGEGVTVGAPTSLIYSFEGPSGTETLNLSNYVNSAQPYVTRTAVLDGGATNATYVYLNFENAAKAAQYVRDYLATSKGASIKSQIINMGSSTIKFPGEENELITLGNALTYINGTLSILPSANSTQLPLLNTSALLAKQRYRGLFSTLRPEAGVHVGTNYKMVSQGIVNVAGIEATLADGMDEEIIVSDCKFYVYRGNLKIGLGGNMNSDILEGKKGILLVHGDLDINLENAAITGLVLATGKVNINSHVTLTADETVVETLLANDDVAKYFHVYGDTSGNGYLSTESVEISFENWKKN